MKWNRASFVITFIGILNVQILSSPLGTSFTYQGHLTVENQAAEGAYDFHFVLYDAPSGGEAIAGPLTNTAVMVSRGLFTVTLDLGHSWRESLGESLWLEIGVRAAGSPDSYALLEPRQPLAPTPQAVYSLNAEIAAMAGTAFTAAPNSVSASSIQTDAVTADKVGAGQVVKSLNSLQDHVTLEAGHNLTLAAQDNTLTLDSDSWSLTGESGTTPGMHFLGTTDNQPLEFKVNNERVMLLAPATHPSLAITGANVVAGYSGNFVNPNVVAATISGGGWSGVSGGNVIGADAATIAGGIGNIIESEADSSVISGGSANWVQSRAIEATISGGYDNRIETMSRYATIGGGNYHRIKGGSDYGTIAGGHSSVIYSNAQASTIAGGMSHRIFDRSEYGAIGGGYGNQVTGIYGTIPGGRWNEATNHSFAAGYRAKARHEGAFVWADPTEADFGSSGSNQFLIRASGGVGIGLNNPAAMLHVAGRVQATGFDGNGSGLSSLSADNLASGTVPEARLSGNVALRTGGNNFTGDQILTSGSLGLGGTPVDSILDVEGDIHINEHDLFLRAGADRNHGLGYRGAGRLFAGVYPDGPVLYGWRGGILGCVEGGEKAVLTWKSNGYVGVGTTEPDANLDVRGSGAYIQIDGSNGLSGLRINESGARRWLLFFRQWQSDNLIVRDEAGGRDTMTFESLTGRVGIGTRLPAATLEVAGGVRAQGFESAGVLLAIRTVDNQPLELRVNNQRALRLEPSANETVNTILGYYGNTVAAGVRGAVISGGGIGDNFGWAEPHSVASDFTFIGGGRAHTIEAGAEGAFIGGGIYQEIEHGASLATISGGSSHLIRSNAYNAVIAGGGVNAVHEGASYAAIGGGNGNDIYDLARFAVIAGGHYNTIEADARFAVIPGGDENTAAGRYALAAGRRAKARHAGTLVWGDSTDADISSTSSNQVVMRASGGMWVYSDKSATAGVRLSPGSSSWSFVSDRNLKENLRSIDKREVLEKVARLPIDEWNLVTQDPSIRHIGPMAQDFHAAFGLGNSDRHIETSDASGIALAAIQGLHVLLREKEEQIRQLQQQAAKVAILEQTVAELKALVLTRISPSPGKPPSGY